MWVVQKVGFIETRNTTCMQFQYAFYVYLFYLFFEGGLMNGFCRRANFLASARIESRLANEDFFCVSFLFTRRVLVSALKDHDILS